GAADTIRTGHLTGRAIGRHHGLTLRRVKAHLAPVLLPHAITVARAADNFAGFVGWRAVERAPWRTHRPALNAPGPAGAVSAVKPGHLERSLWDSGSDYGVQPPVTDLVILEAERLLNVRLPSSLLDLLRQQNGGQVTSSRNAFPTGRPTSWSGDHIPFDSVLGIGHRERTLSLLDSQYLVEEWNLPVSVVLVSGDGPCWIGLDYRSCGRQGEPSITWFDADDNSKLALAPDVQSFVEGLTSASGFESAKSDGSFG
ncbi:SMI1/KNR4 family protein, partial [Kitasatospora indigofera]|uniref:SMI1/KNR4 family protein n=1 Tax=Kitasatospora indigofera TaxID=67307 RepID=UPI003668C9C2